MSAAPARQQQPTKEFDFFSAQRALEGIRDNQVSGLVQFRILHYLVNQTYGKKFQRSKALRHFPGTVEGIARAAKCSRRIAEAALADLGPRRTVKGADKQPGPVRSVGRYMIAVITDAEARKLGYPPHPKGTQALWYGPLPENWPTAPPYEAPKPKLEKVVQMPAPPDPEPPAAEDEPAPAPVAKQHELFPSAAGKTKPAPIPAAAKSYQFDCSAVGIPLVFRPAFGYGRLTFFVVQQLTDGTPAVHSGSEGKEKGGGSPGEPAGSVPDPVLREVLEICAAPDHRKVEELVRKCLRVRRDATRQEIAYFIRANATRARKADSPLAWLCEVVPPCFEGKTFAAVRERIQREAVDETRRRATVTRQQEFQQGWEEKPMTKEMRAAEDERQKLMHRIKAMEKELKNVYGKQPNSIGRERLVKQLEGLKDRERHLRAIAEGRTEEV